MRRLVISIGLVSGLALGVGSLTQVVVSSPAFNSELRRDNAFGSFVVLLGREMYNAPSYLYQQAASFVRADLIVLNVGEDAQVIAEAGLAEERALQAVELARESLRRDPANSDAWIVLAWGHLLSGAPEAARTALASSWQLAMHDHILSPERIALALTLFDPDIYANDIAPLTDAEGAALVKDFETLWHQQRRSYDLYKLEAERVGIPIYLPEKAG